MKILVTGSEGFIGKLLVKELRKKPLNQVFECDIKHPNHNSNRWFDRKYDVIYHLGAVSDTREKDTRKIYKNNIEFTQQIIEYARINSAFVSFASSASVYGNATEFKTSSPVNPTNLYARSKLAGEILLELSGIRYNALRLFNVYSLDGKSENHKVGHSSPHHKFLNSDVIEIFEGSKKILRDFIHVDEVISKIIEKTNISGIFNVGTGRPKSFLDVAMEMAEITGKPISIIPFPENLKKNYQYYTCAQEH